MATDRQASDTTGGGFDGTMLEFYTALAELQWDKAVVMLLRLTALVEAGAADGVGGGGGGGRGIDAETHACQRDILAACQAKIKMVALQKLQECINRDEAANALVIWEKTKVRYSAKAGVCE